MSTSSQNTVATMVMLAISASPSIAQDAPTTEAPTAATPSVIVEGQVLNHIGAGIAEVEVVARLPEDRGGVLGRTMTDDMGDFRIDLGGRRAGTIVVLLSKQGYTTAREHIDLQPGEPPFIAVELSGDLRLRGRVIEHASGAAVPDAGVRAEFLHRVRRVVTNDDGSFTVDQLSPGGGEVIVDAPGFGREKRFVESLEAAGPLLIALRPERVAMLNVVDHHGRPVAGVSVETIDLHQHDSRTLVSDDHGRVVVAGIHQDTTELVLRLRHEDYLTEPPAVAVADDVERRSAAIVSDAPRPAEPYEPGCWVIRLPDDRQRSAHVVRIVRAGSIVGTVRDASGGAVVGARVSVGTELSDTMPRAWSGLDGTYRVNGVPPGTAVVTVYGPDFAPALYQVEVASGAECSLEIQLRAGSAVHGTVVSESDEPVAGALIFAGRWRGHNTLGLRAETDSDGQFVMGNAPPDALTVMVHADGFRTLEHAEIQVGRANRIVLAAAAPPVRVGDRAPALTLTSLRGEELRLDKLSGKVVLLDFWATWCLPCVQELPILIDIHDSFGGREDFLLVSISWDHDEGALRSFIKSNDLNWHHVWGDDSGATEATEAFNVTDIPATIVVGRKGNVVAVNLRGRALHDVLAGMLSDDRVPEDPPGAAGNP